MTLLKFKSRLVLILILFLITISLSYFSILHKQQLGFMGGMAEEYFILGVNWCYTGQFVGEDQQPNIFRPPGYAFFIASVLKMWGGLPDKNTIFKTQNEYLKNYKKAFNAVYFSQCILLSLSTVMLFIWISNYIRFYNAFILAILFGCNPYLIILAGLFHYDILHIFFTIIACYALSCFVTNKNNIGFKMILSGILFGLTTLIRPVTLILPPFVFAMCMMKFNFSWKPSLKSTIIFCFGMFLVISPYMIRNYYLFGKIIPVNAQGYTNLWTGTAAKLGRHPNHYRFWDIWYKHGVPIYFRATKEKEFSPRLYMANGLKLDDAFKKEAFNNIYRQPGVYFYNVLQNFFSFNLDINSVFIKIFQVMQEANTSFDKEWLEVGNPQTFYSSSTANAFEIFINLLTLFGFAGICMALIQKEKSIFAPGMVYLCICTAHSITYMDLMYYYIKIPFLYIFTSYLIKSIDKYSFKIPLSEKKCSLSSPLNYLMLIFILGLVGTVIL